MCCQHRRAFSFEMVTSEPKTTCNRPKFNAYVLRFCFCSVVRHLKICTQIVLKPSRLIFFLLLLLSFLFVFFVMLSYVFSWCVPSLRVPRVCYSVTQFVIQFLLRFSLYVSCFFFIFLFGFSSSFSVRLAAYLSSLHCSFCYVCFSVVLFLISSCLFSLMFLVMLPFLFCRPRTLAFCNFGRPPPPPCSPHCLKKYLLSLAAGQRPVFAFL